MIGPRTGLLSNDKLFPGPAGVPLDIVNSRSVIGGGAGATSTVSNLKRLREDVARLTMTALETLSVETTTANNLVHSIMRRMIAV